jgi:hypothetical protein
MNQEQINQNIMSKSIGIEEQKDNSPNIKMKEPDDYDRLFMGIDKQEDDFDGFEEFGMVLELRWW